MSEIRKAQKAMVIVVAIANGVLAMLMIALGAGGQSAIPLLIPVVLLGVAAALLVLGLRMR
jgi:hypothetical protein